MEAKDLKDHMISAKFKISANFMPDPICISLILLEEDLEGLKRQVLRKINKPSKKLGRYIFKIDYLGD